MSAIVVRNIPERVHKALRRLAKQRQVSVEALARGALEALAKETRSGGIDFAKLAKDRAALGLVEDGPAWTSELDDPVLSRRVLGVES
jgi:plasmid stability protein